MSKIIKIPLLLLFITLVVYELFQVPTAAWENIWRYWYWILPVFVGTFLNWGIETIKWKRSMQDEYPMTFKDAWRGIIWGNMFSFITPNRTGSFLGRIILLPQQSRLTGVMRSTHINILQFISTLLFGFWAIWSYAPAKNWMDSWSLKDFERYFYLGSMILVILLIVVILLRNQDLSKIKNQIKTQFFRAFNQTLWSRTPELLLWSVLRYLVFVTQYLILIYGVAQQEFQWEWFSAIALAFFLIAIFPISIFSNIGVREQVFIWVFSPWIDARIALISLIIWLLNVLFPVVLGIISYSSYKKKT